MKIEGDLHWLRIYWVRGTTPRNSTYLNAVKDPPCSGWQSAFVIMGEKHSTIFCPYSFQGYPVMTDCDEIVKADEPRDDLDRGWIVDHMHKRWAEHQALGWQSDYDIAAAVLTRLGAEVPEQVQKGGEKDERRKGGKPVASSLLKPVRRDGKRGRFLQWILTDNDGSVSIRACMIQFEMTRSNALSYLHAINKDHGIGYELVGDTVTLELPPGCEDPFDIPPPSDDDDDDWLD